VDTLIDLKFGLANNLQELFNPGTKEEIMEILKKDDLASKLPNCREAWVVYEGKVQPNISLKEAHKHWSAAYFPKLQNISDLPQQPIDATTQTSLIRVSIECINKKTGGMSSFYGFEGYYLSLLLSLSEKCIWDSRGEPAS